MRSKSLHGYTDSFFVNSVVQTVNELFDGNMDYLAITLKMSLHDVIMVALRNAGLLSGVVFHGGTCLQRMYGWSRFSEDLDFANIAKLNGDHFIEFSMKFDSAIRAELKRLGFTDDQIMIKNPKNLEWPGEVEPSVRKWSMRVDVGSRNMKQVVNIELADMPSYQYSPKAYEPLSNTFASGPVMVNVEPLNVIFNDKAISIIQRPFVKNRDIYDVGLLSDSQSIDRNLFLSKMADRKFTSDHVKEKIENVRQLLQSAEYPEKFSAEMSRFVIPGRTTDVSDRSVVDDIVAKSLNVLEDIGQILDDATGDNGDGGKEEEKISECTPSELK